MKFFKISSLVQVPEESIEAICTYESIPVRRFVSHAREQGRCFSTSSSQKSIKSIILTSDGSIYTAMYYPKTYVRRLDNQDYFRTDSGCYINQRKVKQIINRKNLSFRRYFESRNNAGYCLNLSRHKGVGTYLVTESDMVYACHLLRDESERKEDSTYDEI